MAKFNPRARVSTLFVLLVVLYAVIGFSQVVTGTILGRVTDTSGAVVPGTTIQMQNVDTGFSQTATTDSQGRYLSQNLPLGSYTLIVQQTGFQTQLRRGISLSVASEVTVNVELSVGNVQERVEVTATAPLIETTNATLSGLVTPDQMRDLPLNGRNIDALAMLSPGVLGNRTTARNQTVGVGTHLSVNGSRPDSILYLLDGSAVNDSTNNGRGSAAGPSLGVEGIREFRLLTHNFSAEYGRNGGGVISAVTRSGTNELHGSAYEFVRNNIFDARNFFNPGELPAFRRNQFGAAVGGRIIKDRVFFFANYEGLRQRQGNTVIASVPDLNARRGLVPNAITGQLEQLPVNPAVVPYVNLYPLPNGPNHGDGTADYISDFSSPATDDYAMERMDFRLSDKDSFYWRYVFEPSESAAPELVPSFISTLLATDHFVSLGETHIFSGASLNEFRFGFNRTARGADSIPIVDLDPSLSFVPGKVFGTIQYSSNNVQRLQLSTLGTNPGANSATAQNRFQQSDTFSTVRGAHSLKFGVELEHTQFNYGYANSSRGAYQFGGLQALLAGQSTQFKVLLDNSESNPRRGWRRILFGWFVQDDFRVSPRLTLNLGLRHEFQTIPSEVNGLSSSLRSVTDPKNTPGPSFETPKANFAPRVGLAWDPTGSGKTSVRLGAGVFYNHMDGIAPYARATTNADFLKQTTINNPPFPNAISNLSLNGLQANGRIQFHSKTPTVIHYNLEVQRQLWHTLSVRAGYVGSHSYNLTLTTEQNIRIPQIMPDGSKFWPAVAPSINPNFAQMTTILTAAHSNYNGLQMMLQKSISAGLTFQASYTYSKALSNADQIIGGQTTSVPTGPMDIYDLDRDYSLSAYDQRHTLVLNASYQMPWEKRLSGRLAKSIFGGWAINGIYSYGSGLPFDILTGFNNSRNGDTTQPDRPDITPGFSNNPIHGVTTTCQGIPAGQKLRTPERWFDPCAFTLPAVGFFGNLGRQTVTAPGLFTVDFTIVKTTPLSEKKGLEFRAEFFNLLNHANFGLPINSVFNSSRVRSGNAGTISNTTTDNRQIQLGMKLIF